MSKTQERPWLTLRAFYLPQLETDNRHRGTVHTLACWPEPTSLEVGVNTRTVLVVEDEPIIRMIAVEALEDAGFTTVEFATAQEAIAFCASAERDIAAVFTDINMPGDLDGLDLVSVVSRMQPHVAVVVSSGRYQERPADLPRKAAFLPKPWRAPDLIAAIKNRV